MKARFYIKAPEKTGNVAELDENESISQRSSSQLNYSLKKLEPFVKMAAEENKKTMAVVVCGEDFFQGGEISNTAEEEKGRGRCMDLATTYDFFSNEMCALSKKYPNVLIIPGSVYVSVDANAKEQKFNIEQDGTAVVPNIFVQNVVPVFYGGE